MNIVPVYPNFVPLAQQPATEAARRDNVRRERIPEPAESTSGQTDNRLDSSSESSPRYASTTSADTYSAASVKHNALKNSNEGGDAYFGLSGHLFRFHPARRFGVIRPA